MKVQVSALIFNAVLDPIFIYPLGLGVAGAALATLCAFAFSLLLYVHYVQKKSASPQM
jgi:Na+-driven multidrug efflux pump